MRFPAVLLIVPAFVAAAAAALADPAIGADSPTKAADQKNPTFELRIVGPDGKPVPEASVELRTRPLPEAEQILRGRFVRKGPSGTFATADAEGRLIVKFAEMPRDFAAKIVTAGFGPYWAAWSSENSEPMPADFTAELDRAWSVGGIVVDEQGEPIAGAAVQPSLAFKKRPGDSRPLGVGGSLKTDAAGRWRHDSVPISKQQVYVEVNHPAFKRLARALPRREFEVARDGSPAARITLARGLTVTGKVTDENGQPISGALVRTKFLNDLREAPTGDDGVYRLGGCEPLAARIVVSAKGKAVDARDVRIEPEPEPVNFAMQPGRTVRIRVLDNQGRPVHKASIFFQKWRGERYEYFELDHVSRYADENGLWVWNEAPVDDLQADICPPDGMQQRESFFARDEEFVFRTSPALEISGRVIDSETKAPIKEFQILPGVRSSPTHMNWVEGGRFKATDGKYSIRHVHESFAHIVRVEATGYLPAVSRDVKSTEGKVTVDFELSRGQNITAKVVTPDLKPATKAKVALGVAKSQINIENGFIEPSPLATVLEADDTGQFQFPPREADYQLVIVHSTGYAHVKAAPDREEARVIRLQPWARVEGTFRVGENPVANVPITINTSEIHSYGANVPSIFTHHDVTTGSDGRFVFDRVFAGTASIGRRIMLTVSDGATEATSAIMIRKTFPGGETTRVDLGGSGRAVVGKLQPPAGFEGKPPWNFALINVDTDGGNRPDSPQIYASVARDGSFRIDDLPEGKFKLGVRFENGAGGLLVNHAFAVPAAKGPGEAPVDLGTLTLDKR